MSTFEDLRKHWEETQKNDFWDAWGIVLHTKTLYDLMAEIPPVTMTLHDSHIARTLFGLTVIEADKWLDMMEQDCVIVDKPMGELVIAWEAERKRRMYGGK